MKARPTVLIADQSEAFVTYLSILLNRLGFNVIPTKNGIEVLHVLRLMRPDVVILSADMHGADGVETLKQIRQDPDVSEMPVVILFDSAAQHDPGLFALNRPDGYLVKPITIDELHEVLQDNVVYPDGKRRMHIRTRFDQRIGIVHEGKRGEYYSVSLSDGGVYVRAGNPLPIGTVVTVELDIWGRKLTLPGTVIYQKGVYGEMFKIAPGMAVLFDELSGHDAVALKGFITELLISDIVEEQEEPYIVLDKELPN